MRLKSFRDNLELYNRYFHISIHKNSYKMCFDSKNVTYFDYEVYSSVGVKKFLNLVKRDRHPISSTSV